MDKKKVGLGLILLLVLPSAMGDLMANIYNMYVPIYLQAGSEAFSKGQVLTNGFGLGAFMVGFWMIADNILGLFIQPFVGAWSDRLNTRLGRRIPIILFTLPIVAIGYAVIPLVPQLIPPGMNGQFSQLAGPFALFTAGCAVYFLGYMPARVILQTLRQEAVGPDHRSKVEAWFTFLLNITTIIAYTLGAQVYKAYGPLLFWILLGLYVAACILLAVLYKEPRVPAAQLEQTEKSSLKQLAAVLRGNQPGDRRNLYLYLASVMFVMLAFGATANFSSSWVVNIMGMDEARAASILSLSTLSATLIVLPAGYLAGGKLGRRTVYIIGLVLMIIGGLLISFAPSLYTVAYVLMGAGSGAFLSSMLALLFDIVPGNQVSGALVGIFNIAYFIGFIFGSLIVGAVIEQAGYPALYPAVLVLGSSSLLCILLTQVKAPQRVAAAQA